MFRKALTIGALFLAGAVSQGCVTWLGAIALQSSGKKAQASDVFVSQKLSKGRAVDWLVLSGDDLKDVHVGCFVKMNGTTKTVEYVDLVECGNSNHVDVSQYLPGHIHCKIRKECLSEDMDYGYSVFVGKDKVLDPEVRIKGDTKGGNIPAPASQCPSLPQPVECK
jgi:hypothetical protein